MLIARHCAGHTIELLTQSSAVNGTAGVSFSFWALNLPMALSFSRAAVCCAFSVSDLLIVDVSSKRLEMHSGSNSSLSGRTVTFR